MHGSAETPHPLGVAGKPSAPVALWLDRLPSLRAFQACTGEHTACKQANPVRQRPQQASRTIRLRLGSYRFLGRIQPVTHPMVQFQVQWLTDRSPCFARCHRAPLVLPRAWMYSASFSRLSSALIWGRLLLGKTWWNRAGAVGCTASGTLNSLGVRSKTIAPVALWLTHLPFLRVFQVCTGKHCQPGTLSEATASNPDHPLALGSHRFLDRIKSAMKAVVQFQVQWLTDLLPSGQCAGLGLGLVDQDSLEPGWCSRMDGIAGSLTLLG